MFEIYKNKKVLITGHTGFKGSWLAIWMIKLGAKVIGYALDPKNLKDNFNLSGISSLIKDYRADIRNFDLLKDVINSEEPDIIFHLAAQPLVLESYENPHYTFETNIQGTLNVLEAFRKSENTKVLIVITTDKVYQNKEWIWGYRENDELGGKDPYSASKTACEMLIDSYLKSFFPNSHEKLLASVRAGNVIGGGDWSENRLVPDCIKAIEKDEEIIIRNPNSTRPWQHVLEPLGGYLLLGLNLLQNRREFQGAWNFGPLHASNKNVEFIVKEIISLYGKGNYIIQNDKINNVETNFLSLDITKAIKHLNWEPLLSLNDALSLTVEWYKNYNSNNVLEICLNQIEAYENIWKLKKGI